MIIKKSICMVTMLFATFLLFSCQALLDSNVFSSGKSKVTSNVPYEEINFFERGDGPEGAIFGVSTNATSNSIFYKKNGKRVVFGNQAPTLIGNESPVPTQTSMKEESIWLRSAEGKGKVDLNGQSGIAFIYQEVVANKNFIMTATFDIERFGDTGTSGETTSNGQEGFGIMARDSVNIAGGSTGGTANMVMLGGVKRGVRLAWQQGVGGTLDSPDIVSLKSAYRPTELADYSLYETLEQRPDFPAKGETYTLMLQKNNSGFYGKITRPGNKGSDLNLDEIMYYAPENLLLQQENEKFYVGFFTSRNARITVSNINYYEVDADKDLPRMEEVILPVQSTIEVQSSLSAADADYEVVLNANVSGTVQIKQDGSDLAQLPLQWMQNVRSPEMGIATINVPARELKMGENIFTITFYPDRDKDRYKDGTQQALNKNGEPVRLVDENPLPLSFTVVRKAYDKSKIYVSPTGRSNNNGTPESPLDLHTALSYIKAGQEIIMTDGIYNMQGVYIERYNSGSSGSMKKLTAENRGKAIIDFNKRVGNAGFELWGSYWHINGIDVRNTPDKVKGFVVSGSNNIIEWVKTYNHGDTGFQISGRASEPFNMWPTNNSIQYCESYNNKDAAMIDADGFAAKLTVGEGNKFLWCLSHHNADDGWDLFAKKDTGPIGVVAIENCIAYRNGTLLNGDRGPTSGRNGFKLGGSGIAVKHVVRNSLSFQNGAHGFTSNSNPAVQIYNCTAFDNGWDREDSKDGRNFQIYNENNETGNLQAIIYRVLSLYSPSVASRQKEDKLDLKKDSVGFGWTGSATANKSGTATSIADIVTTDLPLYESQTENASRIMANNKGGFIKRTADGTFDIGDFMKVRNRVINETDEFGDNTVRKTGYFSLNTIPSSISALSFSEDEIDAGIGSSVQLLPVQMPLYSTGNLKWNSSAITIDVNEYGVVSVLAGTAPESRYTITVRDESTGASASYTINTPKVITDSVHWQFNQLRDASGTLVSAQTDVTTTDSTKLAYVESNGHPEILLGGGAGDTGKKLRLQPETYTPPSGNYTFSGGALSCNNSGMTLADFGFVQGPFTITVHWATGNANRYPTLIAGNESSDMASSSFATTQYEYTYSYTGFDAIPVKLTAEASGSGVRIFDFIITMD